MSPTEIVRRLIDALETLNLPYMMVGAFSVNVYGNPRSTKDADVVVELGNVPISRLRAALGDEFGLDPQMTFETITSTTRYRLRHLRTVFLIEVFLLSADPFDRERFARRTSGDIGERRAFVPTPEDVVIQKLRWSKHGKRQKDVADARGVLAVQAGRLDLVYVRRWCDAHGTRDLLESLLLDVRGVAGE